MKSIVDQIKKENDLYGRIFLSKPTCEVKRTLNIRKLVDPINFIGRVFFGACGNTIDSLYNI